MGKHLLILFYYHQLSPCTEFVCFQLYNIYTIA